MSPTALSRKRWADKIKPLFNALRLLQDRHAKISSVPHRDDEETWTEWVERALQDAAIDEVRVEDLRAAASTVDEAYETGSVTMATLTELTLLYKGTLLRLLRFTSLPQSLLYIQLWYNFLSLILR